MKPSHWPICFVKCETVSYKYVIYRTPTHRQMFLKKHLFLTNFASSTAHRERGNFCQMQSDLYFRYCIHPPRWQSKTTSLQHSFEKFCILKLGTGFRDIAHSKERATIPLGVGSRKDRCCNFFLFLDFYVPNF